MWSKLPFCCIIALTCSTIHVTSSVSVKKSADHSSKKKNINHDTIDTFLQFKKTSGNERSCNDSKISEEKM